MLNRFDQLYYVLSLFPYIFLYSSSFWFFYIIWGAVQCCFVVSVACSWLCIGAFYSYKFTNDEFLCGQFHLSLAFWFNETVGSSMQQLHTFCRIKHFIYWVLCFIFNIVFFSSFSFRCCCPVICSVSPHSSSLDLSIFTFTLVHWLMRITWIHFSNSFVPLMSSEIDSWLISILFVFGIDWVIGWLGARNNYVIFLDLIIELLSTSCSAFANNDSFQLSQTIWRQMNTDSNVVRHSSLSEKSLG